MYVCTFSAIVAFLLILHNFGNALGDVIGPRNEAVVSGGRMVMPCTVGREHDFLSWTVERVSDRAEDTVFQFTDARPSVEKFGIHRDGAGSYSLYANSTAVGDAGTYRCIVRSKATKRLITYSAQLVVIDSPPSCRTNLTTASGENASITIGELFFMQCSIRYQGNLNLSIEWKRTTENGKPPVVMDVKVVTSKDAVTTSNLNVIADFSTPATFTWRAFFPATSVPHSSVYNTTAKNAPDYEYVWNSPLVLPRLPVAATSTTSTPTAKGTDLSSPATPNQLPSALTTEGAQETLLRVVSENWVIAMLGCIVLCFLVAAGVACYCVKSRRRINEQRIMMYRQMSSCGSNNTTGTSINNETYDAIDEAIVYCDISHTTSRDVERRRPSLSSPSSAPGYATMTRRLPATPPASQSNRNCLASQGKTSSDRKSQSKPAKQAEARRKGVTIDRNNKQNAQNFNEALETAKSSSLPNLYNDIIPKSAPIPIPNVPSDIHHGPRATYGNVTAATESSCYVTQSDVEHEIDSTYLEVNELSKRGKDHQIRKPYLEELNEPYLLPNPV